MEVSDFRFVTYCAHCGAEERATYITNATTLCDHCISLVNPPHNHPMPCPNCIALLRAAGYGDPPRDED